MVKQEETIEEIYVSPTFIEEITIQYFKIVDADLKIAVNDLIDKSKIASLTELLIIAYQPLKIKSGDEAANRKINAEYAFVTAGAFIMGMQEKFMGQQFDLGTDNQQINNSLLEILADHISHLQMLSLSTTYLPVIFNAKFWRLLAFIVQYSKFPLQYPYNQNT